MRELGVVERVDGKVESVTFAILWRDDGTRAYDFRTTDGAPLVLGPGETVRVDYKKPGAKR